MMPGLDDSSAITVAGFRVWDEPGPSAGHTGQNYVREVFSRQFEQNRAERILLSKWQDRIGLAIALLGGSISVGGISQGIPPSVYPAVSNWICQRIEISGDGLQSPDPNVNMIAFERARNRVIYGPPQWDPSTTNTGEIELDFSSGAIAMDQSQSSFKWTDDDKAISSSIVPVLRQTTVMVSITKYDLAVLPINLIMSLIDCTNSGTFLGASAEQIVFRGARSSKKFTAQGIINWDYTAAFEFNKIGWNSLWKPGKGPTPFYYDSGSGHQKLFTPQNLQPLIA